MPLAPTSPVTSSKRRRPIGAEPVEGCVHVRVWAPSHESVAVVVEGRDHPLDRDGDDYFSGIIRGAAAGTLYRLRLDGDDETFPDPASRFQPEGPHGPSMVVDPSAYVWRAEPPGVAPDDLVLYEMHVGTYTAEGTWRAAMRHFDELRDLGVTMIELMPVNEFPGRFGWGYDGVDLWAPLHLYGTPDDFRAFVDGAHAAGLSVILDVVYNHFGPDGCYLSKFSKSYFTDRYVNEWGEAVNFDGDGSGGVREFVSENAAHWIDEYHLDGLRLDATQSIIDNSGSHVVALISRRAREAASGRSIFLVGENEPQLVEMITKNGLDALWNDDWHHAAHVAATGRREAYYSDYAGTPQEFVSMAKHGFLYQGQHYSWQKHRRGTPSMSVPPRRLVAYLQNHDQVANSARGLRLHDTTSPGRFRALTALMLLGPNTPMLFQGEEFAASAPFLYFADHKPELAEKVAKGRHEFLRQFPSMAVDEVQRMLAVPHHESTFLACKIDHAERETNAHVVALHRDLLRMRRDDRSLRARLDGAVLSPTAFVLRFMPDDGDDRLLIVNLGVDLRLEIVPEPLLAPPLGRAWSTAWSSEDVRYGGVGAAEPETDDGWLISAESATLMAPSAPLSRTSAADVPGR